MVVDGAGYVISIEEIEEKTAKGKSGEEASSTDDAAAEDEEGTSVDESNTEATTPDDTTIDASTDPEQEASTPTVEPKTLAQVIKAI